MDTPNLNPRSRRRLLPLDVPQSDEQFDTHGFLDHISDYTLPAIETAFEDNAAVILAPPHYGKSFEAKAAWKRVGDLSFGKFVEKTSFELGGLSASTIPSWWPEWRASSDARACWIVDAVDEDLKGVQTFKILEHIEQLSPAERARLTLVMFCRENQFQPSIQTELHRIYPSDNGNTTLRIYRLAPISEDMARVIADSEERLQQVCALIRDNALQDLARYPAVVKHLADLRPGVKLSVPQVWRGVLNNLLVDARAKAVDASTLPNDQDCFDAATRLGACLALSGSPEIAEGAGSSVPNTISRLFSQHLPKYQRLYSAAWSVVRTALFRRPDDGYRFAQRNIQEWFAAFELEDVRLAQLHTLFVDRNGTVIPEFQGILALLVQVSLHKEVRDWIVELHHGIPPISDAAPITLEHATERIDRLIEIANQSPFGLGQPRELAVD